MAAQHTETQLVETEAAQTLPTPEATQTAPAAEPAQTLPASEAAPTLPAPVTAGDTALTEAEGQERGVCCKCSRHCLWDNLVLHSSCAEGSLMVRRPCQAVVRLTTRAWGASCLRGMNDSEQAEFFKACHNSKFGRRFTCHNVRLQLKQALVRSTERLVRSGVSGAFQPLCYYEKLGYSAYILSNIEQHAEAREDPILGKTFEVDVLTITREHVEKDVRRSPDLSGGLLS